MMIQYVKTQYVYTQTKHTHNKNNNQQTIHTEKHFKKNMANNTNRKTNQTHTTKATLI